MRRPKWTMRSLMIGLMGLGVALGLGIPAFRAFQDEEGHGHTFVAHEPPNHPYLHSEVVYPPYWSRFQGHLTGRGVSRVEDCGARDQHRIEEACSWGHPEVYKPYSKGGLTVEITPRQQAAFTLLSINPSGVREPSQQEIVEANADEDDR